MWIEHAQVAVGVRNGMGGERQNSTAEIDFSTVLHEQRRFNDRAGCTLSQDLLEPGAVVLATLSERIGKARVPDKRRLVRREGTRAENVIRVHVGENHVPNWKFRHLTNGFAQFRSIVGDCRLDLRPPPPRVR